MVNPSLARVSRVTRVTRGHRASQGSQYNGGLHQPPECQGFPLPEHLVTHVERPGDETASKWDQMVHASIMFPIPLSQDHAVCPSCLDPKQNKPLVRNIYMANKVIWSKAL